MSAQDREHSPGMKFLGWLVFASAALYSANTALGEDSEMFRPYVHLRSAAANEKWGAQDGWGVSVGANFNSHLSLQLSLDKYESVVEDSQKEGLFEEGVLNLTPEIRLRYPIDGGRWVPYLFAGPGVAFLYANDAKPTVYHREVAANATQFSAAVGAGLEYFVADNISFTLEGKYAWVQPSSITVSGIGREVNFSSALLMLGVRAYFPEVHKQPLIDMDHQIPTRLFGGFRYGNSILLDRKVNSDLRLENQGMWLGNGGNEAGSILLGVDFRDHFGLGMAGNYSEYTLASQKYGTVGEYSTYSVIPEARWHWLLLHGKLSPFVGGGAGITYAEYNDRKPGGEFLNIRGTGFYPAVDVGAGMEYFIARNWSVSTEAHYFSSWNHRISINGLNNGSGSFSALNLYFGLRFYLLER